LRVLPVRRVPRQGRRREGAKKTSGTGLGLHITRKIVTEMGGAISVESEPCAGSTFSVRLPTWVEPVEPPMSLESQSVEAAVKGAL
jgi:signal transduction histidine kinase